MLTVEADNSDLTQILRDVSRASGIVIDGGVRETRVYGTYGPANASSILFHLLDGMGYNIVIVERAGGGAPKRLMLSDRTVGPTAPAPSDSTPAGTPESVQQNAQQRADQPQLPPGAIPHPPPTPSEDQQARAQQNLERLRKMQAPLINPATPPQR
jgi:hypothetical protein